MVARGGAERNPWSVREELSSAPFRWNRKDSGVNVPDFPIPEDFGNKPFRFPQTF